MHEYKETLKRIQKERENETKIREIVLEEKSAKYTISRFGGLDDILNWRL
jgi:hypothetical protein